VATVDVEHLERQYQGMVKRGEIFKATRLLRRIEGIKRRQEEEVNDPE